MVTLKYKANVIMWYWNKHMCSHHFTENIS